MYAYVGGDPVNATDPNGLERDEIVVTGQRRPRDNSSQIDLRQRDIDFIDECDSEYAVGLLDSGAGLAAARKNQDSQGSKRQQRERSKNRRLKALIRRAAAFAGVAILLNELNDRQNVAFRGLSGVDVQSLLSVGAILPKDPGATTSLESAIYSGFDSNFIFASRSFDTAAGFAISGPDPSGLVATIDLARVPGAAFDVSDGSDFDGFTARVAISERIVAIVGPVPVSALNQNSNVCK